VFFFLVDCFDDFPGDVCAETEAPPVETISWSGVILSQKECIVNAKGGKVVRFESRRVHVLFLECVGQCLYHESELPLALCFGALDTKKASVFIATCGVVAIIGESLYCFVQYLAQYLALARLFVPRNPYLILDLVMCVR
jgi:hypothetical protein